MKVKNTGLKALLCVNMLCLSATLPAKAASGQFAYVPGAQHFAPLTPKQQALEAALSDQNVSSARELHVTSISQARQIAAVRGSEIRERTAELEFRMGLANADHLNKSRTFNKAGYVFYGKVIAREGYTQAQANNAYAALVKAAKEVDTCRALRTSLAEDASMTLEDILAHRDQATAY